MPQKPTYEELETKLQELERKISRSRMAEEEIIRSYDTQEVVTQLIEISLENFTLDEILQKSLDNILSIPWLSLDSRGSIHIVEADPEILIMKAQKGLEEPLIKDCATLPFGKCLCGRAAAKQKLQFSDHVDDNHEILFDGMEDHGHYCTPILYSGKTIGVLNIYTRANHVYDIKEVEFLHVLANTLAAITVRKTAELAQQETTRLNAANEELMDTLEQLQLTQNHLVQSEKMASLGSLVAGVAHEINTPVGISYTAATHLEQETKQVFDLYHAKKMKRYDFEEYLKTCLESTCLLISNLNRSGQLIRSFKQVAIDQAGEVKRNFNLREYVEEILLSLRPIFKNNHHGIIIDCPDDLVLNSYPGAISQILTNLITNSINHGFKKILAGEICLQFSSVDDELVFRYEDNGRGIAAENLEQIFEPFFTTNRENGGDGLGMYIVYNIVNQQLNGTISCQSQLDHGVIFTINLPLTWDKAKD